MAGRATRHLNKAKEATKQKLQYLNMVRKHLLPDYPPVLDYTRENANEVFHEMWLNNALGAEKNWEYRVFREWSLVQRGKEEFAFTASEIQGSLAWARSQAAITHARMMDAINDNDNILRDYWAYLLLQALERQESWNTRLSEWETHCRDLCVQ